MSAEADIDSTVPGVKGVMSGLIMGLPIGDGANAMLSAGACDASAAHASMACICSSSRNPMGWGVIVAGVDFAVMCACMAEGGGGGGCVALITTPALPARRTNCVPAVLTATSVSMLSDGQLAPTDSQMCRYLDGNGALSQDWCCKNVAGSVAIRCTLRGCQIFKNSKSWTLTAVEVHSKGTDGQTLCRRCVTTTSASVLS